MGRVPATITALPVELLIDILSPLSLKDQVSASLVCTLWRSIIVRHLLNTRYNPSQHQSLSNTSSGYTIPSLHRIIFDNSGKQFTRLGCIARNGIVESYFLDRVVFKEGITGYQPSVYGTSKVYTIDVSTCSFLDERLFSPSAEVIAANGFLAAQQSTLKSCRQRILLEFDVRLSNVGLTRKRKRLQKWLKMMRGMDDISTITVRHFVETIVRGIQPYIENGGGILRDRHTIMFTSVGIPGGYDSCGLVVRIDK
ncbi:hypothetical protein ABW19_dt0201166 [Dactylella cylindrospora]|nr:hypothetical protein ABW19_dt0201166 [Dactylella cylindrospora]